MHNYSNINEDCIYVKNLPRQTSLEFRGWVTFLYGVLDMWKPRPDAGIYEFPLALIKKVTDYFKSSKSLAATKGNKYVLIRQ